MMAMTSAPLRYFDSSAAAGRRTCSTMSAPLSASAGNCRAGRRVVGVENARFDACAGLHRHLGAEPDHLLDGLGGGGDARLGRIDFGRNCDFHNASNGRPHS